MKKVLLLLGLSVIARSQPNFPVITKVASDPSGACSVASALRYNTVNGKLWGCDGTWAQIGAGSATLPASPVGSVQTNLDGTNFGGFNQYLQQVVPPANFSGSGLNDLSITGSVYTGATQNVQYDIKISTAAGTDKFQWRINPAAFSAEITITGASQALSNGIAIKFAATTGHTLNDTWSLGVSNCLANNDLTLAWCLTPFTWPTVASPDLILVETQGNNNSPGGWELSNGAVTKNILSVGTGSQTSYLLAGGASLYDISPGLNAALAIAGRAFGYYTLTSGGLVGQQVAKESVQGASGSVVSDGKGSVDWDLGGSQHFIIDANNGMSIPGFTFANLGTPSDATQKYCSNCKVTSGSDDTCVASGGGATAFRINGAWKCLQ